jgi:hypothetical protein
MVLYWVITMPNRGNTNETPTQNSSKPMPMAAIRPTADCLGRMGRPHFGHDAANRDTSFLQSGHEIRFVLAIIPPFASGALDTIFDAIRNCNSVRTATANRSYPYYKIRIPSWARRFFTEDRRKNRLELKPLIAFISANQEKFHF